MSEFPEDNPIQLTEHDRGVVRKLVKVCPSRKFPVEALYQVNLVRIIMAGQFLNELRGEVSELVHGYRGHGPHCTLWTSFAYDSVSEKDEPIIDVSYVGLVDVEEQFEFIFQKPSTFLSDALCVCLVSLYNQDEIIGISAVCNRWQPLSVFRYGYGAFLVNSKIPSPAVLPCLLVQVFRLQPLIKFVQHDVG